MNTPNNSVTMSPMSSSSSTVNDSYELDMAQFVLSSSCDPSIDSFQKSSKKRCYRYPWTEEEDYLLIQCVQKFGVKNWKVISENIPGRTGKQCRQRWLYNLSPDIQKRKWTAEEDEILMSTQKEVGNKWTLIRKKLPGRSENDVKNRYHSIMNRLNTRNKKEERMTRNNSQNSFILPPSVVYPIFEQSDHVLSVVNQNVPSMYPSSNEVCKDIPWVSELSTQFTDDVLINPLLEESL